jgi:hypothetical protein
MKNQAIQYLALDVHQATTVATVRDDRGSIRIRSTVPTEAGAVIGLGRGVGPRVHVVFEEGTQAQWLHDLLQPHAERVVVCNVRGRSETTNKSDRIDADWLSEMLRLGAIKPVHHASTSLLTLKELVRCYTNWWKTPPGSRPHAFTSTADELSGSSYHVNASRRTCSHPG